VVQDAVEEGELDSLESGGVAGADADSDSDSNVGDARPTCFVCFGRAQRWRATAPRQIKPAKKVTTEAERLAVIERAATGRYAAKAPTAFSELCRSSGSPRRRRARYLHPSQ